VHHIDEKNALDLLKELATHVSFDANINDKSYGRVNLKSEASFWVHGRKFLPSNATSPLIQLVHEIDASLKENACEMLDGVGHLHMEDYEDSLWQRIQSNFAANPFTPRAKNDIDLSRHKN
jgi:hypothetical protein